MSDDKFKIDSHKLMYHVNRVSDWLNGENVYPIYMEISPTGRCNHRCIFCSVDFMGYKRHSLDTELLETRLSEMGKLGLKSIMYAGEGEPFLHKDMARIIEKTGSAGIDAAVTTNGVPMKPDILDRILPHTQWIKVSINAGTKETYAKIHRTKPADFQTVIDNLSYAVEIRKKQGLSCTLGAQILLLPENANEVVLLANTAREIGLNYLVVKPYTHNLKNTHNLDICYDRFKYLTKELRHLDTDTFKTIFRIWTMKKWDAKQRGYRKCLALPFWSYMDSAGNIYGCSTHLQNKKFHYGNVYDMSFKEIWEGRKRQESLNWVHQDLDLATCKFNCRMDKINEYLWKLKHMPDHVNFI